MSKKQNKNKTRKRRDERRRPGPSAGPKRNYMKEEDGPLALGPGPGHWHHGTALAQPSPARKVPSPGVRPPKSEEVGSRVQSPQQPVP